MDRTRRARHTRLALVAATLALLATTIAGCSDDDDPDPKTAGSDDREVRSQRDLYAVPDPLPTGEHGDLVRYQPIDTDADGMAAYRIMYLSESVAGEPIVVTGVAFVPEGPAPDGGRPVLAVGHGASGIADKCAPSRSGDAYGIDIATAVAERGWIVTMTDYEGLGTPGRHPFFVGESEGRGILDSVLAVGDLPDAHRSAATMISGGSQGGHAAMWASELAAEWTPELDVVGTAVIAPAVVSPVLEVAANRVVVPLAYLMIAGFDAAYPDADPSLILTEEGERLLDTVDSGCLTELSDFLVPRTGLVRPDGPQTSPWPELAAANDPGQTAVDWPLLILHSDGDGIVPVEASEPLFDNLCAMGQHAERRVLVGAGGHSRSAGLAYEQALEWFDRLVDGEDVPNTCE